MEPIYQDAVIYSRLDSRQFKTKTEVAAIYDILIIETYVAILYSL